MQAGYRRAAEQPELSESLLGAMVNDILSCVAALRRWMQVVNTLACMAKFQSPCSTYDSASRLFFIFLWNISVIFCWNIFVTETFRSFVSQ